MTILDSKQVKTRKPHKCWGCMRVFAAGSKMEATVSVDDDISITYWCETCIEIIDRDRDLFDPNFGIGEGELIENYPEEFEKE